MSIVPRSNRYFAITSADAGNILALGPGSTASQVGAMTIQFEPSADFSGSIGVMAKPMGVAAETAHYLPVPYRRVNVGGAASDYALVSDLITNLSLIQVPLNGIKAGLLIACDAGSCSVFVWDMDGSSAI